MSEVGICEIHSRSLEGVCKQCEMYILFINLN